MSSKALVLALLLSIAFLLFVTSCIKQEVKFNVPIAYQPNSLTVYAVIGDDFKQEEKEAIISAVEKWRYVANGALDIQVLPTEWKSISSNVGKVINGKCVVVAVFNLATPFDKAVQSDDSVQLVVGATHRRPCSYTSIWMVEEKLTTTFAWEVVAMHELGHAMGMNHIPNEASIMNESFNDYKTLGCLTRQDLEEFCDVNGCDVSNTSFCVPSLSCL